MRPNLVDIDDRKDDLLELLEGKGTRKKDGEG